ncbi:hypothetical protein [Streptomyces sp. NBC_01361]|uniref:hypothetical protein n=1 Tax=Streptomyces sp. NBC_01361 TaxID=2903838 RepID=UPI002E3619E6|nr:hypothetical protein [Streptomyces sp. NBC_01361]
MPTPYGNRGGMAFGAEELRVLRRALALALHPSPVSAEDIQDCLRLAESVDEAADEGARIRAFLLADLARYRAALPGTATGYLELLGESLAAGYRPGADDLAALRALRGNPSAATLLERCRTLTERDVRARLEGRASVRGEVRVLQPRVPASRTRLLALPGGLAATGKPASAPRPPANPPAPPRPMPTPAEVFPPKRRPAPPAAPPQELAVG